ncbi:hypothetical protein LXL04_017476 [Taraxacum kok-saghyz]
MSFSIRVEAEFAEARTEALTTTISSLWRSDRGEFSYTVVIMFVVARLVLGQVILRTKRFLRTREPILDLTAEQVEHMIDGKRIVNGDTHLKVGLSNW